MKQIGCGYCYKEKDCKKRDKNINKPLEGKMQDAIHQLRLEISFQCGKFKYVEKCEDIEKIEYSISVLNKLINRLEKEV